MSNVSEVAMSSVNGPRLVRSNLTRWPFGAISKASPAPAAPLTSTLSRPSWPSMVSEPSPLFHTSVSSPAPPIMASLPRSPTMRSPPGPPLSVSLSSPPLMKSAPAPPLIVSRPVPPLSSIAVGVAGSDDHVVVAAVGVEHEALGVGADVELERRGAHALEADAAGVGGRGEVLGAVAAVELGVVAAAGAAVHDVVVVAGVPDHDVVAGVAVHRVVGAVAGDAVVAGAAVERVVVVAAVDDVVVGRAGDRVVAVLAVDGDAAQLSGGDRDRVGAAAGVHREVERVVGRGRRGRAVDGDELAVVGDRDRLVGGVAGDRDVRRVSR